MHRVTVPRRSPRSARAENLRSEAKLLLAVLPIDGVSITNRAARALLSQKMAKEVTNEEYFVVRDELISAHLIGRVRGQGGSIFRLDEPEDYAVHEPDLRSGGDASDSTSSNVKPISERDLMFIAQRALALEFPAELDLPKGSPDPILEDISTSGPRNGVWARPDFVMVSVSPYSLLPGMHVDTHVFELKNEAGGGMRAVHEALAQGRFANFCHLIWLVPDGSERERELATVSSHCALHGVGLIRLRLTDRQTATLEVLVDARRMTTTALEIDGFLEARLSDAGRHSLARALKWTPRE